MPTTASMTPRLRAVCAARALDNLQRYTGEVVDWPTPVLPDDQLDYYARQYQIHRLAATGLRFIAYLQHPGFFLNKRISP